MSIVSFIFPIFYQSITFSERILYYREDADSTMKLEFNSITIHTVEVRVFGIAVYRVSSLYASAYRCIWKILFSRMCSKSKCAPWSICRVWADMLVFNIFFKTTQRNSKTEQNQKLKEVFPEFSDQLRNHLKLLKLYFHGFLYLFLCKDKWWTPLFTDEKEAGVEEEFETGLSCIECLPACDETKFSISTTRLPLRRFSLQAMVASKQL